MTSIIKSIVTDKEFILRTLILPFELMGILLLSVIVGVGLAIGAIIGIQLGLFLIPL